MGGKTMTKSKFTPDQKIQIVLESIRTSITPAELCRKHNVHPHTLSRWKQRFMDAGKASLQHSSMGNPADAMKREQDNLKRIIGELTIANDILKKPWREAKIECCKADERKDEPP